MAEAGPKGKWYENPLRYIAGGAVALVGASMLPENNNRAEVRSDAPVADTRDVPQDVQVEGKPNVPTAIEGVIPNYTLEFADDALVSVRLGDGLPPNSIVGVYIASSTFTGRYDVPQRASSMSRVLETYQSYSPTDTGPVGGLYFETSVREDGSIAIPSWIVINGVRINVGPGTTFGVLPPGGAVRTHMLQQNDIGAETLRLS